MDKVIHFEIPADDMKRAKKFYGDIFGWGMQDVEGEMEYTVVRTAPTDANNMLEEPGAINGGLMRRMSKTDAPIIVIEVPSIDERIKKIIKAGGKVVMPKMEVLKRGLYARVTDSEGNVIGIWENIKK
jgi:uncharacterized protein